MLIPFILHCPQLVHDANQLKECGQKGGTKKAKHGFNAYPTMIRFSSSKSFQQIIASLPNRDLLRSAFAKDGQHCDHPTARDITAGCSPAILRWAPQPTTLTTLRCCTTISPPSHPLLHLQTPFHLIMGSSSAPHFTHWKI